MNGIKRIESAGRRGGRPLRLPGGGRRTPVPPKDRKEDVMRKALSLVAVLAVLTVAAVVVVHQPKADAAGCLSCPAGLVWTTGQWGFGSTCAQAENNAILAAYNYADSVCWADGVCNYGAEEIVTPCMWTGSEYKADGRIQYRCTRNLCM
jgi:hypothetical protein